MEDSDEDPSSMPHRLPAPRPSNLAIIDATSLHPSIGLYSDPHSSSQPWHASHPPVSGRSSRASTDNEELESVREVLRQRRLSRQSTLINHVSSEDTYAGIKAIKLAIQEHELPVKMAYKQLDELAANAERVRASIEKNRSLLFLQEGCHVARMKRFFLKDLHQIMSKKKIWRVFDRWNLIRKTGSFYKRAVRKFTNKRLRACFRAWRFKDFYVDICSRKILRRRLAIIFAAWVDRLSQLDRKKELKSKIQRKRLLLYFNGFRHGCQKVRWKQCFQDKLVRRISGCKLKVAFQAWLIFMQIQEQKKALKLQDYVAIIEKENERSKLECARLSRIVESGEWGKQQYAEILQAKDVLTGEREALTALIGRLNQQQTSVLEQKERNDNEMRQFKDQLFGNNFIHQNKMLIKGASSFNTVVRALKMDALKRGVNSEFLFALDRLAMDKVSIFPDGEIRVKTFCNFEKGKWTPKATSSCIPDLSASCNNSSLLINKVQSSQTMPS